MLLLNTTPSKAPKIAIIERPASQVLNDLQAEGIQTGQVAALIGQQSQLAQSKAAENLHADAKLALRDGHGALPNLPCQGGRIAIVQGLAVDDLSRKRMTATHTELLEERDGVKDLLG